MKKTLIVVRHAKSSWSNPGLADIDRPLNKRGYRSAVIMGQWLNSFCMERGIHSIRQLVSSSNRTRLTAKLINEALENVTVTDEITRDLYLASTSIMKDLIHSQDDTEECVMIVGHNPGSHELVDYFSSKLHSKFPTCAVACFELDIDEWDMADAQHCKTLEIITPKQIQGD